MVELLVLIFAVVSKCGAPCSMPAGVGTTVATALVATVHLPPSFLVSLFLPGWFPRARSCAITQPRFRDPKSRPSVVILFCCCGYHAAGDGTVAGGVPIINSSPCVAV